MDVRWTVTPSEGKRFKKNIYSSYVFTCSIVSFGFFSFFFFSFIPFFFLPNPP